jgi:anti-sigma factor RsiW
MCDFSGKLIAWLDRELPTEESTEVEWHLESCSECRAGVDAYRKVSGEFDAYCDAAIASSARRGVGRWAPAAVVTGAVAALVALFLAMPRARISPRAFHAPQGMAETSPAVIAPAVPASVSPVRRIHRRAHAVPVPITNANAAPAQDQNAYSLPNEPMIQIAIPADAIYPPGAVPEGMHFVADLTIAADGSAEGLRLRPRFAGFERRTIHP